jgi:rubrerythrin
MGNIAESLQTALEMERRGREYYFRTAEDVADPVVKSVLLSLAHDEIAHENVINSYYDALQHSQGWPTVDAAIRAPARALDRIGRVIDEVGNKIGADPTFLSAYEGAREMELRSREFYSQQLDSADDEMVRKLFSFLLSMEQIHLQMLELLIESIRDASH